MLTVAGLFAFEACLAKQALNSLQLSSHVLYNGHPCPPAGPLPAAAYRLKKGPPACVAYKRIGKHCGACVELCKDKEWQLGAH